MMIDDLAYPIRLYPRLRIINAKHLMSQFTPGATGNESPGIINELILSLSPSPPLSPYLDLSNYSLGKG